MLICVSVAVVASVFLVAYDRLMVPVTTLHNVYVLQAVGSFGYWLQEQDGTKVYATFCDTLGYEPPFDKGETIVTLRFKNRGTCWDMRGMHPKYIMDRDQNGNVIIKED